MSLKVMNALINYWDKKKLWQNCFKSELFSKQRSLEIYLKFKCYSHLGIDW